ncbi:MAG: hypothetical protein IPJ88_11440 [Myxococcales bacterium]|nr:MAG: hypothetical protein IPJ88_11440 [Myxococcales bacterium]
MKALMAILPVTLLWHATLCLCAWTLATPLDLLFREKDALFIAEHAASLFTLGALAYCAAPILAVFFLAPLFSMAMLSAAQGEHLLRRQLERSLSFYPEALQLSFVALGAVAVGHGCLAALGYGLHKKLFTLPDPRIHDLTVLALVVLAVVWMFVVGFWLDTKRTRLLTPNPSASCSQLFLRYTGISVLMLCLVLIGMIADSALPLPIAAFGLQQLSALSKSISRARQLTLFIR